jgi:hypothetical protein
MLLYPQIQLLQRFPTTLLQPKSTIDLMGCGWVLKELIEVEIVTDICHISLYHTLLKRRRLKKFSSSPQIITSS